MNRIEEGVSDGESNKNSTGVIKKLSKAPADMSKKQQPASEDEEDQEVEEEEEDNYSSDDDDGNKFGMDIGALRKRDMDRDDDENF